MYEKKLQEQKKLTHYIFQQRCEFFGINIVLIVEERYIPDISHLCSSLTMHLYKNLQD